MREQVAELRAVPGPPPSLDSLYPPFTEGPVYLQRMRALSAMLTGVGVDLAEQDVDNARSGFARFRDEYVAVAQLVPEWADDYPIEPVDGLGAVLESGSRTVVESLTDSSSVCPSIRPSVCPPSAAAVLLRCRAHLSPAAELLEPRPQVQLRAHEVGGPTTRAVPLVLEPHHGGRDLEVP